MFLVDKENAELVAKVFDGDIQEKQVCTVLACPCLCTLCSVPRVYEYLYEYIVYMLLLMYVLLMFPVFLNIV